MLCYFLLYSEVSKLYIYIYSPPETSQLPPYHVTEYWAELPVFYSRFSLAIYFTHGSIYTSILISQFFPLSPSPHVHMPILYISISIPALKIGSSVHFSRFHIYALIYDICFSLSYFPLYDRLSIHPYLLISTPHMYSLPSYSSLYLW